MGFTLKTFIQELNSAMSGNIFTRYFRVKRVIKNGEEYARACGLIR